MLENKNLNKEYKKNFNIFQEKLLSMALLLTFISFIIQLIYFPMCYFSGIIETTIPNYIIIFIVKPTMINLIAYLLAKHLYKNNINNKEWQTLIPVNLLVVMCCNTLVTHAIFGSLYTIYILPILLTMVYGDLSITRKTTINTLIVSSIGFIAIKFSSFTRPAEFFVFNIILVYCLILCSHIITTTVIKYEQKKEKILFTSFNHTADLENQVNHDGLTKLYNHQALIKILENKIENKYKDLQIAILDIDFFKKVNDIYGHEAGNVVLCKFAEMLKEIENADIKVARYGGEEFVAIFTNYTTDNVFEIIERLRREVSKITFEELDNKNITFSAGIAKYNQNLNITEFFEKADEALYNSKENGRNQTSIAK